MLIKVPKMAEKKEFTTKLLMYNLMKLKKQLKEKPKKKLVNKVKK